MTTCPEEISVGAYILGSLDQAERARVSGHIETCARCQAVRDDFAGLPGVLARLTRDEAAIGPVTPREDAYQRFLAAAAAHRSTRRHRFAAAAVAAGILLGAGGAGAAVWQQSQDHRTTFTATRQGVQATVTIGAAETGSRLSLELSGVHAEQRCRLVVVGRNGDREVAGTWVAKYDGSATINGWAALAPEQVSALRVETLDGQSLVRIPLES